MKVLLVYPVPPRSVWPRGIFRSHWVPSGLAYLSTALCKGGHEVRVIHREENLEAVGFDWEKAEARLRALLAEYCPEMVGVSAVTPMIPETELIAIWAKEICGQDVIVVAGGPHPTALPERTLADCPAIDVAVVGEAEQTIVELADHGPREDISGIVLRQDGGFFHATPRKAIRDLDSLGAPDYNKFNMDYHLRPSRWLLRWIEQPGLNISTSRGCTNCCAFCAGHLVSGLGVRLHSVEYVLERLKEADRLGAKLILFDDDTLAVTDRRVLEICEAIKSADLHRRLQWQCCLRADQVEAKILEQMKSAGCIQIEYGFESGSDPVLQRINKNTSTELNRRAVRLTREAGLRIYANIMAGLPGETREDFKATMGFIHWAKPDIISAACLLPLPGTQVYSGLSEKQRDSLQWADFTYTDTPAGGLNLTAMTDDEFRQSYREFFKYYVRPGIDFQMLRDTPADHHEERRRLRKKVLRFALRHPVRASRLR